MLTSIKLTVTPRDGVETTEVLPQGRSFRYKDEILFRLDTVTKDEGLEVDLFKTCHLVYADGLEKYVTVKDEKETVCEGQKLVFTFEDDQVTVGFDFSTIIIVPPKEKKPRAPKKTVSIYIPSESADPVDDEEEVGKKRKRKDAWATPDAAVWLTMMFCTGQLMNLLCAAGRVIGRDILGAFCPDHAKGISKAMISITKAGEDRVRIRVETDKYSFALVYGNGKMSKRYKEGNTFVLQHGQAVVCFPLVKDVAKEKELIRFSITKSCEKNDDHDLEELGDHEGRPEMTDCDTDVGEEMLRRDDNVDTKKVYDGLSAPKLIAITSIVREMLGSQIKLNGEIPDVRGDGEALDKVPAESVAMMQKAYETNKKPAECVKKIKSMIRTFASTSKTVKREYDQHESLTPEEFLRIGLDLEKNYKAKHGEHYNFTYIIKNTETTRRDVPRVKDIKARFVGSDEELPKEELPKVELSGDDIESEERSEDEESSDDEKKEKSSDDEKKAKSSDDEKNGESADEKYEESSDDEMLPARKKPRTGNTTRRCIQSDTDSD